MAQIFGQRATFIFRLALMGGALAAAGAFAVGLAYVRSDSYWHVGEPAAQPIPFRHDLHAGGLGIDCRFCHSAVERAASAGMPSAHTCLTCHSQVWSHASVLEPLRTSVALRQPIEWQSVHRLPTYAYFHHGAHVSAGVACASCHGRVEEMKRTVKAETLSMGWCLDCHRNPPSGHTPGSTRGAFGDAAAVTASHVRDLHGVAADRLTDCSTCHR